MAEVKEIKKEEQSETPQESQEKPQSMSIEQVLAAYPVDRDKARDVLLIDISRSLMKIADSMPAITEAIVILGKKIEK